MRGTHTVYVVCMAYRMCMSSLIAIEASDAVDIVYKLFPSESGISGTVMAHLILD